MKFFSTRSTNKINILSSRVEGPDLYKTKALQNEDRRTEILDFEIRKKT